MMNATDHSASPLAARVHALIAQWRSDAESALYAARMFIESATEEEWYESRAMGRAQTYKECAFDLEAALAAALAPTREKEENTPHEHTKP